MQKNFLNENNINKWGISDENEGFYEVLLKLLIRR